MASKDNPTEQTSTEDAGVHRLRDIVAEEVSLVDRAANKRRFLVVKRSTTMADDKKPDKKAKPTEEEDATKARTRATRAASEGEEDDEEETEKARGASEEESEKEDEEKADDSKSDEEEDDEGEEEDEEKADEREDDEDEDEESKRKAGGLVLPPDAKTAVLQVLAQALERLMAVGNRIKDADEPGDGAEVSVPDDLTGELEDVGELLEEVGEQLAEPATVNDDAEKSGTAKRGVTKAGRRMAAGRLDRFQKALELLSAVLKELTEERKPPSQRPAPPKKSAAKGDATGIPELVASIHDLTKIVKRQEQDITRLAKARGTSNAIPVDSGRRRESQDDVSWPLDMNRPITRDRVDKSVSFYDDP